MLAILANSTYRHLFGAQIVALLGTGLATVALGLLAYDLSGADAGLVLGMIFTIKMVAYVLIAPIAGAFADRMPPRALLVALDLVRGAAALALPFVSELWQVFALVFVLQSASAAFTPTFQATIPDILQDEAAYTRALSLSRLAYDLENIISPTLAAMLLLVVSYDLLFAGTALGFVASALLVVSVTLPRPAQGGGTGEMPQARRGIYDRTTRGLRIFLATPRLRGLLALTLAASAGGAMVLVNSVVLVQAGPGIGLGFGESGVAWALAAFGGGSMLAALLLPPVLDRLPDRLVMLAAAGWIVCVLSGFAVLLSAAGLGWVMLLVAWALVGLGYSTVLTPSGRLLRRSSHAEDRPAVFAAQFALSHLCWLVAYPLAGALMTVFGAQAALLTLATIALAATIAAARLWLRDDPEHVTHTHPDLPVSHPHLRGGAHGAHSHAYVIDDLHRRWPRNAAYE